MEAFTPSRSLLNPKFEGYKLDAIPQEDVVVRYSLQYKPTQAAISGKSFFSFQEVQNRITHNHIAVYYEAGRAAYIDEGARLILIDVDRETLHPSFRVLFELPTPTQSDSASLRNREYPSAAFLTPTILFVSDGYGLMYILQIKDDGTSSTLGIFTLSNVSTESPFRIHSVHRVSPVTAVVLVSSRYYAAEPEIDSWSKGRKATVTEFDIFAVKIELLALQPQGNVRQMDVLWSRRGQDVPIYTTYHDSLKSFLLVGGSQYSEIGRGRPQSYEPSPDEIAPIPRADENFDTDSPEPPKPPPYSWTQTSDSVTIAIPLPSSTPKHTINVIFSPRALTVHIDSDIHTSLPTPHYSAKPLWDNISSFTSYWTWDREAEHTFGLLTLYLDKQHEGTRWSQVFASSGTSAPSESGVGDIEVPETLDPSELWNIRESMEKFTISLREGDDVSGLGLGKGMPSLAEGEIDVEVDESVGRSAYITWVGEDGTVPTWQASSENIDFQLLSVPLPGTDAPDVSLIAKNNLDGIVFSLQTRGTDAQDIPQWTHTSTFSALAFVLASKRDVRFTYHVPKAVFAFEGGIQDRGGNVYIYRAALTSEKWAKQAILKVDDGHGGPLLGVGVVKAGITSIIICLTEGELVLIKNP